MRLTAIHTYPIKGCRGLDHDSRLVQPWGLAGDRRWMIADPGGTAITQREDPRLALLSCVPVESGVELSMDGRKPLMVPTPAPAATATGVVWGAAVAATPAGPAADGWLSHVLDRPARLLWLDDPTRRPVRHEQTADGDRVSFADGFPLLLASSSSLDRLNEWITESGSDEGPLPMNRFRPNVVISGAPAFIEDEWIGRRIRIGQLTFRVPKACGRCVVTTTDQQTAERGGEPLRTLARHRKVDQKLLFGVNLIPDAPGTITLGDEVAAVE